MALTPIARFDVVPYQRITSSFNVGVVAFSKPGIQDVSFSFNGAAAIVVTDMSYNSRTDVWEYWTALDPADYTNGQTVTIDATVTGIDGGTRVLPQMYVVADNSGAWRIVKAWVDTAGSDSTGVASPAETGANPYATLGKAAAGIQAYRNSQGWGNDVDGGIIYLEEGTHGWGSNDTHYPGTNEWMTITRATGATKANTTIQTAGRASYEYVKITGISLNHVVVSNYSIIEFPWPTIRGTAWVHNCTCTGSNTYERAYSLFGNYVGSRYVTESSLDQFNLAVNSVGVARGIDVTNSGDDPFRQSPLIINCTTDNVDPGTTGEHADAIQFFGAANDDNVIIYNFRGTNLAYQGLFWRGDEQDPSGTSGAAIINAMFLGKPGSTVVQNGGFTIRRSMSQCLIWHVTVDHTEKWYTSIYQDNNMGGVINQPELSVIGSSFRLVTDWVDESINPTFNWTDWDQNHYETGAWLPGSSYTTGDPMLDSAGRPETGSPLLDRVNVLAVKTDIDGNVRTAPTSLGVYRGPSEGGINSVTQQNTGLAAAVSLDTTITAMVNALVTVPAVGAVAVVALDTSVDESGNLEIVVPNLPQVAAVAFDPGTFYRANIAQVSVKAFPTTILTGIQLFNSIPKFGDFALWTPTTSSRWSIAADEGSDRLILNTSDYAPLSGKRLGEIAIVDTNTYANFTMHFTVKTQEAIAENAYADFAFVFGYVDANTYKYFLFNSDQASNQVFDVVAGDRGTALGTAGTAGITNELYHGFSVVREGTTLTVTKDGASFFSLTNAAIIGRGQVGIGGYNDSSIWDNIKFTAVTSSSPGVLQVSV